MKALAALRSAVFALLQWIVTPIYFLIALCTAPFPPLTRYRVISGWARIMIRLARIVCGVRYRVLGAERIPPGPCILLANHQSAWETMAFQVIFPPQVWVLKKELLRVPFFGWGLSLTSPIAIDRRAGSRALKETLVQGRDRLAKGFWIVIFPEGTRRAPGDYGKYQIGGAWLAVQTGTTVLPVAHNAGELWRRNAFVKYPGLITVSVGPPIDPTGMKPDALNERAREWIVAEATRLHGTARR